MSEVGDIENLEPPVPDPPAVILWPVRILQLIGGTILVVMSVHIVVDVIARNFFNHPFIYTMDFIQFWWMPIVCFTGIAVAQSLNDHVIVETIFNALSPGLTRALRRAVLIVAIGFVGVLLWGSWENALEKFALRDYASASLLPIWPPFFIIPLALAVMIACMVWQLISPPRHGLDAVISGG